MNLRSDPGPLHGFGRCLITLMLGVAAQVHAGFFNVSNTNDSGSGSLRQAVTDANASPATPDNPNIITFTGLGGSDVTHTITLDSALPGIERPALLLGNNSNTVVVQPTTGQRGNFAGLHFEADAQGSSVYFLTLQGFEDGVLVRAEDFTLVGNTIRDSRLSGLRATDAVGLIVGGANPTEGNVFVENGWDPSNTGPRAGMTVACTELDAGGECELDLATTITANYFGLERDTTITGNEHYGLLLVSTRGVTVGGEGDRMNGFVASGNSGIMVREQSRDIAILGNLVVYNGALSSTPLAGPCASDFWANHCDGITVLDSGTVQLVSNIIADNTNHGIAIRGGVGDHCIRRNDIGFGFDENDDVIELPNGGHGIYVSNADNNTIGSELSADDANGIAFNGGDGIAIFGSQHNAIHPNAIRSNAADGIRLANNSNGNILPPIVTSLSPVSGTAPGTGTGVVYLFADAEDEGAFYLGSAIISDGTFSAALDLSEYEGLNLTAIQTREDQSSRFSAPLPISSDPFSVPLTVTTEGAGTVTSNPAGIDCGPTCGAMFDFGVSVELHAEPAPGWQFSGWEGACAASGTDPSCVLTMDAPHIATAIFTADDRIFGNGFEPN